MTFSLIYYCGTKEIWILSLPGIKEILKKVVFAFKSLQSDQKVSTVGGHRGNCLVCRAVVMTQEYLFLNFS